MNQDPEEIKRILITKIFPHTRITFETKDAVNDQPDDAETKENRLFEKQSENFGSVMFLKQHGTTAELFKLIKEHRSLWRRTAMQYPVNADRRRLRKQWRPTVLYLIALARKAKRCEAHLQKKAGIVADAKTGELLIKPMDIDHRPKRYLTQLVEEAFEQFRGLYGTKNSSEMREAIAARIRPMFQDDMISADYGELISDAIENYVRKIPEISHEGGA